MLTFSDVNIVNFVDYDSETDNEKVYAHKQQVCFHQERKCSAEVRLRMIEDSIKDYVLRLINADTNVAINDIPYTSTPIVTEDVNQIENYKFDLALPPWENSVTISGGSSDWEWSADLGGCALAVLTPYGFIGDNESTKNLKVPFSTAANRTYKFKLTGAFGYILNQRVKLYLRKSSNAYNVMVSTVTGSDFVVELSITPLQDCDELIIVCDNLEPSSASSIRLQEVELMEVSYGGIKEVAFTPTVEGICDLNVKFVIVDVTDPDNEIKVKRSDFVIFDENTDWVEIKYKGESEFAGMPYDEDSPYFIIYFPAQFFRQRGKLEVVIAELNGGVKVNTASSMEQDRKFIMNLIPDYFHNMFLLILQHAVNGSLLIDGFEWVLDEGASYDYTLPEDETHPHQGAIIYLTREDYATNNLI